MDLNSYQRFALATAKDFGEERAVTYGALGLAGEAGEVADLVKKALYHDKIVSAETVAEELGDVLWYVAFTAWSIGYSLEDVAKQNVDKLNARHGSQYNQEFYSNLGGA